LGEGEAFVLRGAAVGEGQIQQTCFGGRKRGTGGQ
jgi:hypothetical protein